MSAVASSETPASIALGAGSAALRELAEENRRGSFKMRALLEAQS
jgi:hypothetical protein